MRLDSLTWLAFAVAVALAVALVKLGRWRGQGGPWGWLHHGYAIALVPFELPLIVRVLAFYVGTEDALQHLVQWLFKPTHLSSVHEIVEGLARGLSDGD